MNRHRSRWALALILLSSLLLNVFPITWGLPSANGWAFDELTPRQVEEATGDLLAGRERGRYPPLHYLLLTALHAVVELAMDVSGTELGRLELYHLLFLAGRCVSLLMACLTVYLVYRIGRELFDRATSLLAAAVLAVVCPFVFYAKTANLDVPYLSWFALAVLFFLRAERRHRLGDYLGFAAAAALAVCTKDQAYGLFVLAPLPLVLFLRDWRRQRGLSHGVLPTLSDRRMLLAAVLASGLFALIHNLLFDWHGFTTHIDAMRRISSPASEFGNDFGGHLGLLAQNARNLAFSLGWPLFLVTVVGLLVAARRWRSNPRLLSLLFFPISYHLFFIAIVRYSYDRFLLPVALVLALFAAPVLSWVARRAPVPRWLGATVVATVLLYTGAYSLSVDLTMHADSRYELERWLHRHSEPQEGIAFVGRTRLAPRVGRRIDLGKLTRRPVALLRRHDPRFVVTAVDFHDGPTHRQLLLGRLNYHRILSVHGDPVYSWLDFTGVRSNLQAINPRLEVYERSAPWGWSRLRLEREMGALFETPDSDRRAELTRVMLEDPIESRTHLLGDLWVAVGLRSLERGYRGAVAAMVVSNPSATTLVPELRMRNEKPSAAAFSLLIEDGVDRVSHRIVGPDQVFLELAPVAARSRRLYLIRAEPGPDGATPRFRLGTRWVRPVEGTDLEAIGLDGEGWTSGSPVLLTTANLDSEGRSLELRVSSDAALGEVPVHVVLESARGQRRLELPAGETLEIVLWSVPPLSEEVVVLWTDRMGSPGTRVRVLPGSGLVGTD